MTNKQASFSDGVEYVRFRPYQLICAGRHPVQKSGHCMWGTLTRADGSVALFISISRFESFRKALANLVPKEPRSDGQGSEQDKCDDANPKACHALIICVDPNGARRRADSGRYQIWAVSLGISCYVGDLCCPYQDSSPKLLRNIVRFSGTEVVASVVSLTPTRGRSPIPLQAGDH